MPSKGKSAVIKGLITDREHHLFSNNEISFFYLTEFSANVIDIREQFPLFPIHHGVNIAEKLNISNYPLVPSNKENAVMPTDFLLTIDNDGEQRYLAVSVKDEEEEFTKRTAEKLEIERIWWELLGVPFKMFVPTESELQQANTIYWLTNEIRKGIRPERALLQEVFITLQEALSLKNANQFYWSELLSLIERSHSLRQEDAVVALKYLIYSKLISIDLSQNIQKRNRVTITNIQDSFILGERYEIKY